MTINIAVTSTKNLFVFLFILKVNIIKRDDLVAAATMIWYYYRLINILMII